MRLFWACTHITLRNTEVPLMIERGIEVIPEEANVDIVTVEDAIAYDADDDFSRLWRSQCTLTPDQLDYVRRARLLQRQGLVSASEQAMFNALFDVIYIPTFLAVAANVKSWFKGEVIFRYFGAFANLRRLDEQCADLDPDLVRQLYFLPIFSTLADDDSVRRFDRASVLHPVIEATEDLPRWDGVWPGQSAVLVSYPLHEGWDALDRARALIPLAERIPITVLGKNDLDRVPDDIKQAFHVVGSSDRETHLRRLANARLLLYPNDSSIHMHYVPLEALAAGIPILCRNVIPLIKEFNEAGGDHSRIGGIAYSSDEFMTMAEEMFRRPDTLPPIAEEQAALPVPFTCDNVRSEIDLLKTRLRIVKRGPPPKRFKHPLAHLPTTPTLMARRHFAETQSTVPLVNLTRLWSEPDLQFSKRRVPFDVGAAADANKPFKLEIGAFGDRPFAPDVLHDLAIEGTIDGDALLFVTAELWSEDGIERVARGVVEQPPRSGDLRLDFRFALDKPAFVVLYLSVRGGGRVLLTSVDHRMGGRARGQLLLRGAIVDRFRLDRKIRSRAGIGAVHFAEESQWITHATGAGDTVALAVGTRPSMIQLAHRGVRLRRGESVATLTLAGAPGTVVEIVSESWSSACESYFTSKVRIDDGQSVEAKVMLEATGPGPTAPVFYLRTIKGRRAALLRIRLDDPVTSDRDASPSTPEG